MFIVPILIAFLPLVQHARSAATAVYQGCFELPSATPGSPISYYNLKKNVSLQTCMDKAIAVGATAFGMATTSNPSSKAYCYTGSLSALKADGSLSVNPYCDANCPMDNFYPCGDRYDTINILGITLFTTYSAVVHTIVITPDCTNTSWSSWSSCSQTCDKGVQNRYRILNNGTGCTSTEIFEYQPCSNAGSCKTVSAVVTSLQSQCASINGYYAYSTCYFLASTSGDASTVCAYQNAIQASFFGSDLVSQLGSVFLQSTSVIGVTSLQYVGGAFRWILNTTNSYPFLSNETVSSTGSCVSLISKKNDTATAPQAPHLENTACTSATITPICMKSDHVYSSYSGLIRTLITEQQSPEALSYEMDAHACGARCSRIISCLGFNYNSGDQSCLPTKVSQRTPITIAGYPVYTIQTDADWTFYERI